MSIGYTLGESEEQRTYDAPAYEHRTVVNPLYGLRRIGKEQYQMDDPFDLSRQPIKYGQWMNIKVLQVGDTVLSAERILQLLANYEGAHVESNQMTRLNASSPVDMKLPAVRTSSTGRALGLHSVEFPTSISLRSSSAYIS